MNRYLSVVLCACAVPAFAAQTSTTTPPSTQKPKTAATVFTLSGCVQSDEGGDQYTLWDPATDADRKKPKYRLSGVDLKLFAGHRVRVVGGLVPSANVAAQAGALDPSRSSMVNPDGGRGPAATTAPLAEFRVKRVTPISGPCPPQ